SNTLTGSTGSAINANGGVNRNGGGGDTSWEFNTRATGTPWFESKTKFLHIGTSGSYININNNYYGNGVFSNGGVIFANGLGNVDRSAILNTGNLTFTPVLPGAKGPSAQASSLTRFGAESALVYGPFSAQAEYIQTNVSGKGYGNSTMEGAYGYLTYFLTGESRNFKVKTASWDRIKPNHNFDLKGGWGAWELAAGYDYLNLNTQGINGGKASTVKFGLNWYPNSHLRVMADYIHVLDINTYNAATALGKAWNNASLDMIETRVQVDW
ncbi:MAG TPA: porin, partial [Methylococcales bacterium]